MSVNRAIDELATVALTQHDSETRFRALAARGSKREGLALLDKLDRAFGTVTAPWTVTARNTYSEPRPSGSG